MSERTRKFARMIASFASPNGTLDRIEAFGRTDFRKDLKKLSRPTLVIHGDADAIVPFDVSGKRTAAYIKGAQVAVIPGGPTASRLARGRVQLRAARLPQGLSRSVPHPREPTPRGV